MTAPSSLEPGLIRDDQRTHAVRRTVHGAAESWCGDGRIVRFLPGRFDPNDPLACSRCADALRPAGATGPQ